MRNTIVDRGKELRNRNITLENGMTFGIFAGKWYDPEKGELGSKASLFSRSPDAEALGDIGPALVEGGDTVAAAEAMERIIVELAGSPVVFRQDC